MKIFLNGKKDIFTIVDKSDYALLSKFKWNCSNRYVRGKIDGISTMMHRFILNAPKDLEVDHINGNRLDNRRANLRLCTRSQNAANIRNKVKNKLGYRGIAKGKSSSKWIARIGVLNKKIHLGYFATALEAAIAYDEAAIRYFGEFAKTNF